MPYLSSTIFVVSLILAVLMSLTGYWLLVRALFPAFVERAERAWTERPGATVALGVPVALVLLGVSIGLLNAPNGALRVLGFLVSGVSLGFTFAGTAGLAARMGRGLAAPNDAGREWAQVLRAGIVLELTMLFPLLGWFVVAPIAVLGGAGAAVQALFGRKRAAATAVPTTGPVAPAQVVHSAGSPPGAAH
jgi:hypothetical protein